MSRLLISLLLCLCSSEFVCSVEQKDYGVKLCGREFIRAVIFTCGGSRWRRSAHPQAARDPYLLVSYQSSLEGDDGPSWFKSSREAASERPSSSLSDLLRATGRQRDPRDEQSPPEEAPRSWTDSLFSSGALGGELYRSLDLNRRGRSFSLGMAGLCCNQGCTKTDIGHLC